MMIIIFTIIIIYVQVIYYTTTVYHIAKYKIVMSTNDSSYDEWCNA